MTSLAGTKVEEKKPDDKKEDLSKPPKGFEMTSFQFVERMGPGWNLGNTFDGHLTMGSNNMAMREPGYALDRQQYPLDSLETRWVGANKITTQSLFKALKSHGFTTVRIPVTWYKVADPDNNWRIRSDWMARIKQVVKWAIDEDMYVILNTHHEESVMPLAAADRAQAQLVVRRFWQQIATEFKDFNHKLIFEGLNEPRIKVQGGSVDWIGTPEAQESVNILNQTFVDTVRSTGGAKNHWRVLMVPTYAAAATAALPVNNFKLPKDKVKDRIAMSVHSYEPRRFAMDITQREFNPDDASDTLVLMDGLIRVANRAKELNIPVVHGEVGSSNNDNLESRVKHIEFYVAETRKLGMGLIWWDSGTNGTGAADRNFGIIDRAPPHDLYFPEIVAALVKK